MGTIGLSMKPHCLEHSAIHGRSGGSIDWVGIGKEEAIETEIGTFMELLFAAKKVEIAM